MDELYASDRRIESLHQRAGRCVCKHCGNPLTLRKIVFTDINESRIEIFCNHCDVIEYGVEPEIYHCAKKFVEHTSFNYLQALDDDDRTRSMNIAKVCEILEWALKNMGFLGSSGFCPPNKIEVDTWPECLAQTPSSIAAEKTFEDFLEEALERVY